MSQSLVIEVAEAVVAEINGSPVGASTPAVRHYRPQFELVELKTTRLSVVPKGIVVSSLGRSVNQHDVSVDVAVQKKLATTDAAEIDPLMLFVQELADLLRLKRLAAMPAAAWVKTENVPVYALEHLEQQRVFTSVVTVTYRVAR